MLKKEIFDKVVTAFEGKYSWLGRQFAEEFLYSVASWNIQKFSSPEFRVRRHLILFWQPAWLKSSLLLKAYKILGPDLCTMMSDVSLAALRGTVESGAFISPFCLKRPFSICTEFGQVITGNENSELIQKLLNVLEEGVVNVSLGKISYLSKEQRNQIEQKYGITFLDTNTFSYTTDWVLIASTYNKKFLVDNAFESRFHIVHPNQKLDNELTKYITKAGPFQVDENAYFELRQELLDGKNQIDTQIKLPDEIFETKHIVTPRDCGALLSYVLCRSWWNLKTSKEDILAMLQQNISKREVVWKTTDDKVFDTIEKAAKSAQQIADELNITVRQVYYSLKTIRATKIIDMEGNALWKMV